MVRQIPDLHYRTETKKNVIMKTKRISFYLIMFLLSAGFVSGQEYKIAIQNNRDGKLVLKTFRMIFRLRDTAVMK